VWQRLHFRFRLWQLDVAFGGPWSPEKSNIFDSIFCQLPETLSCRHMTNTLSTCRRRYSYASWDSADFTQLPRPRNMYFELAERLAWRIDRRAPFEIPGRYLFFAFAYFAGNLGKRISTLCYAVSTLRLSLFPLARHPFSTAPQQIAHVKYACVSSAVFALKCLQFNYISIDFRVWPRIEEEPLGLVMHGACFWAIYEREPAFSVSGVCMWQNKFPYTSGK